MFCAVLASAFLLRPIRDQFGVDQGIDEMPRLYGYTLAMTLLFAPAFWWLANRLPSRRFVPLALHALAASMIIVFAGLRIVGDYNWRSEDAQVVGEAFWGFFSAFNLAAPALVWIHAVEAFDRRQALRLFGLVGVGGTIGAVLGSTLAQQVAAIDIQPAWSAIGTLLLLEAAMVCHRRAVFAADAMSNERGERGARELVSHGGVLAGLSLLRRSGYLRSIAAYMALLAMTASAFAFLRTRLVAEQVSGGRAQHDWLAHQETMAQCLVLVLQLFMSARLLRRATTGVAMTASPLLSAAGLVVVWGLPSVETLAATMILLRGVQFAMEKPTREALYTPLDIETKHKVKFLLDTVALRLGDWLGACLQYGIARWSGMDPNAALLSACCVALLWALFGARLSRRAS